MSLPTQRKQEWMEGWGCSHLKTVYYVSDLLLGLELELCLGYLCSLSLSPGLRYDRVAGSQGHASRDPGRNSVIFYDFILKVTQSHFCHILFVTITVKRKAKPYSMSATVFMGSTKNFADMFQTTTQDMILLLSIHLVFSFFIFFKSTQTY